MYKKISAVLLLVLAAGCGSIPPRKASAPPMDPTRTVSEQVCTRTIKDDGGNLLCHEVTEAEREAARRAKIAEQEREARARKEAEERAERERLARERAEKLAREEAARRQAAEEARLAAERRRLAAEAERRAREEHERRMREQAEALAREAAAREAAARECRRLEQEGVEGRALLAKFVSEYGTEEEFKGIAGQITTFLDTPRKAKTCPPA